jgi:hypothetical protein
MRELERDATEHFQLVGRGLAKAWLGEYGVANKGLSDERQEAGAYTQNAKSL